MVDSTGQVAFRTAFCGRFGVREDRYAGAVLRRCFPLWSRPLGTVLLAVNPRIFRRELAVIERLGGALDERQIRTELEAYVYETVRDHAKFRTGTLGLRLSRRRFIRLVRVLNGDRFDQTRTGASGPPTPQ